MSSRYSILVCLFCCLTVCCKNKKSPESQSAPEWLVLTEKTQNIIIREYIEALDEFSNVVPLIDDDTEAMWVADTVHFMAKSTKFEIAPFLKKYATISQMQNYIGYGMVYFNAIIGTYKDPVLAGFALNIIQKSDSIYRNLEAAKFEDVRLLALFNLLSIQNMQLFNTLNRINNEQTADDEIGYTMFALGVMDSIANLDCYSDKEIYKISTVLESFSFFQMVCPLLKLFAGNKEKYDSNVELMIEAAKHFDSQSTPVFQDADSGKHIETLDDDQFEKWIITASKHKVQLL